MNQYTVKSFLSRYNYLVVTIVFGIFFAVGFAGHFISFTQGLMEFLTPYFLFIFGGLAFIPVVREKSRGVLIWSIVTGVVTFTLEALGTATGLIFGPYTYGTVLGVSLFSVPLVIAFNWLLVVIGGWLISRNITTRPLFSALLTGLFCVFFDYIMEPVAIYFGYWTWQYDGIPLQNYLAWFMIAFIASYVFNTLKLEIRSKIPMIYVLCQLVFFTALRLWGI